MSMKTKYRDRAKAYGRELGMQKAMTILRLSGRPEMVLRAAMAVPYSPSHGCLYEAEARKLAMWNVYCAMVSLST